MKIKNCINKVISLVLIGLILLPMTVKAEESQETETVILDEMETAAASLNVGDQIYYSNLGWGDYLTNYFTTTVNGIERIAYCLEPGSLTPLPGDYDYEILSSNDNLLKSFYYGYGGPGQSEYIATLGLSDEAQYVLTHLVTSYFYGGDWSHGVNETGKAEVMKMVDWINNAPELPTSEISLSGNTLTAMIDNGIQKTNTLTLTGSNLNDITIPLQEGVTLYNITKETSESGNVKVYGGDSFYLTAPLDLTSTQNLDWNSGDLYGNLDVGYQNIIFKTSENTQIIGSWQTFSNVAAPVSFSATWRNMTKLQLSKRDITNEKELPGAELSILDEKGNIVEEWTSEETPHLIENLPLGKYTLKEITAPNGYTTAEDVSFEVLDTGEIQEVVMYDDTIKVEISKQDIVTGKELPGATLQIIDKDSNIIEEWTSGETPHLVEKLPVGKYTLKEISAPNGYTTAENVSFEVLDTGEIQKVTMYDDYFGYLEIVKVSSETGNDKLQGAEFEIRNKSGDVVETLKTDKDGYAKSGQLMRGEYTLVETVAPTGYKISNKEISFEITEANELVSMNISNELASTNISNAKAAVTGVPETGDTTNFLVIIAILAMSGCVVGVLLYRAYRGKKEK